MLPSEDSKDGGQFPSPILSTQMLTAPTDLPGVFGGEDRGMTAGVVRICLDAVR